jgi:hypothetical protein
MADDLDPFGRRKDENPLASLGWHGDETASTVEPQPEPAVSAEPAEEGWRAPPSQPPAKAKPGRPRERATATASTASPQREAERLEAVVRSPLGRGRGVGVARMIRALIVIVIVFAVLGGIISTLVDEGVDRADRFLRDFETPDVQVPAVPGSDERSPSGREQATLPARGLSFNSLLRPAAFGRAMRRLRTGGYGRLSNLRVAPDRIDATMLTKDGRLRMLQIVPGGRVRVLQTSPGGFTGAPTMALKAIDPGAPYRLTRSAAGRLEQPASRVDYLVLSDFAGARQWNAYFKGGQIFSADARGRINRRVS